MKIKYVIFIMILLYVIGYVLGIGIETIVDFLNHVIYEKEIDRNSVSLTIVGNLWAICFLVSVGITRLYKKKFYNIQLLLTWFSVLFVEAGFGNMLIALTGRKFWSYSGLMWSMFNDQICLPIALVWLVLLPFGFWLGDFIISRFDTERETYHPMAYWLAIISKNAFNFMILNEGMKRRR